MWTTAVAVVLLTGCGPPSSSERFPSAVLGRDYSVQVYVPPGTNGNLPLVLLLDGWWQFPEVSAQVHRDIAAGRLRPFVLVGVSAADDYFLRMVDYKPQGAGAFYDFLEQELLPHLEATQPIAPGADQRALVGHSMSGLFALYALFQRPGLFAGYSISSPSVWVDGGVCFDWERDYARDNTDLPVSLRLGAGGWESVEFQAGWKVLDEKLRSRNYPSLRYASGLLPGRSHGDGSLDQIRLGLEHLHGTEVQP